jgi:hypothetical protein
MGVFVVPYSRSQLELEMEFSNTMMLIVLKIQMLMINEQ